MTYNSRVANILKDLEGQGLTVRFHMELQNTWFVGGEGDFLGHLATGDELIQLEKGKQLDFEGIVSLSVSPQEQALQR